MSDSIIAALVGLCCAGTLEVVRHVLARGQKMAEKSVDDATAFRHDLLMRIEALGDDNMVLSKERDEWQQKYYAEREGRIKAEWQLQALTGITQEQKPQQLPE